MFLSDIPGILSDGEVLASTTAERARSLIDQGVISGGMIPKVSASLQALQSGVGKVIIGSVCGGRLSEPPPRRKHGNEDRRMSSTKDSMEKDLPFPPQYGSELLVISRGRGVWLEDDAGKRYLDFAGGIAVNALGYGRADLARAAYRQMRKLNHISNVFTTKPALDLARKILSREPGRFASVFFGNSGTEANEAALKYARLFALRTRGTGHEQILCFSGAFHGRTMGSLSVTPSPKYQDPYQPLVPGVCVAPFNDVEALNRLLTPKFAGVIVEVIQGEGGLTAMTPQFAAALNERCRETGAVLIADEVQTGLCPDGDLLRLGGGRTEAGPHHPGQAVGRRPAALRGAHPSQRSTSRSTMGTTEPRLAAAR